MTIDWDLMTRLRERQRTLASDSVAGARKTVAGSQAQAQAAQERLTQQQDSKTALWSETVSALDGSACNVERLQQASRWSRALDGKVAQAAQGVAQAQVVVERDNAVLHTRRQALRAAAADLEKAREMHKRWLVGRRNAAQADADEAVDEWAAHGWSRQQQERA